MILLCLQYPTHTLFVVVTSQSASKGMPPAGTDPPISQSCHLHYSAHRELGLLVIQSQEQRASGKHWKEAAVFPRGHLPSIHSTSLTPVWMLLAKPLTPFPLLSA